jgi:hypothetical protein
MIPYSVSSSSQFFSQFGLLSISLHFFDSQYLTDSFKNGNWSKNPDLNALRGRIGRNIGLINKIQDLYE